MITWRNDMSRPEEPHAAAHEAARWLQAEHPSWTVWWGQTSGLFNASHPEVPEIVQRATVAELSAAMRAWQLTRQQRGRRP